MNVELSAQVPLVIRLVESIHLHVCAFFKLDNGGGVHDVLAVSVAFAIMLLNVLNVSVLADVEGVNTVVTGILIAAVVNTAACHDYHITVLTDKEIVVYKVGKAGLADDYRDVHTFADGTWLDPDVNAGFIGLRGNVYVCCGASSGPRAV